MNNLQHKTHNQLVTTILITLCLFWANTGLADIRMVSRGDATANYAEELLREALRLAALDGIDYGTVTTLSGQFEATTTREMLERGDLDVVVTMHSDELDRRFTRVKTDIYSGMLGYRVCLTPRDKPLSHVKSVKDLRSIKIASGRGWRDTDILNHNGMTVVVGGYKELFKITEAGMADCYLRGVHEAVLEQAQFMRNSYTDVYDIDYSFYVHYPSSFGFYMKKGDDRAVVLNRYISKIRDSVLIKTRQGKIMSRELPKIHKMREIKLELPPSK